MAGGLTEWPSSPAFPFRPEAPGRPCNTEHIPINAEQATVLLEYDGAVQSHTRFCFSRTSDFAIQNGRGYLYTTVVERMYRG